MQPVKIVKGKPGEVTFDARGPNKLFPLPREVRHFATDQDYFKFLEADLNAELVHNDKGEIVDYRLAVTTLGAAYYWDYARGDLARVPDFQAYYVGGASGYVYVGGLRCVNAALCGPDFYRRPVIRFLGKLGSIEVEASLPTYEWTEGEKTKITRMWTTTLTKPDPAKILGEKGCEICLNGKCITVTCPGVPTLWELEVDPFGVQYDDEYWNPVTVTAQNEIEVTFTFAGFSKGAFWDLKCSVASSRGEVFAPFEDVAEDFLTEGDCPPF